MTVTAIADKSGILRETLYNRMKSGNFMHLKLLR